MFGVSVADLKVIAKTIKGQQALACELYETGNMDAMYLAGMIADGSQMTKQQLNAWAEGAANLRMIAEYTVPWVTVENPHARELAKQWTKSKKEHVASSGWCTYSGLLATTPDAALDLAEIESLLEHRRQGSQERTKPRSLYHERFCDCCRRLREASLETSQGDSQANRPRFRGRGRHGLQLFRSPPPTLKRSKPPAASGKREKPSDVRRRIRRDERTWRTEAQVVLRKVSFASLNVQFPGWYSLSVCPFSCER